MSGTKGHAPTNFRHGYYQTRTYRSWIEMRRRCKATHRDNSPDYSGRGIQVCARWDSFQAFLADVGERPKGHTLDRINGSQDYEPRNVRWATPVIQSRNTRTVWLFDVHDEPLGVSEAARRLAMSRWTLWNHYRRNRAPRPVGYGSRLIKKTTTV